ncbi:hypothetical protein CEXT_246071 [Caerostris extrusa]|uniref:LAGLIDADG homing endonuclease n=1 Tax=Caerostris extrusa TaxID=172846 RepID=A0AAV4WPE5_CAEEX|nr:hypothetical protein CEXT_246071 [Caerostris extrusa]
MRNPAPNDFMFSFMKCDSLGGSSKITTKVYQMRYIGALSLGWMGSEGLIPKAMEDFLKKIQCVYLQRRHNYYFQLFFRRVSNWTPQK